MRNPKHRLAIIALFAVFAIVSSTPVTAQVQTARYVSMTTNSKAFYEYLPQGYSATATQTYPLMIFLHGLGEMGPGTTATLPYVLRNGPPKLINAGTFPTSFTVGGQTFKYIVISPQFSAWPNSLDVNNIIDYAVSHYKVDVNRIYLTGLSMGGGAVWLYAAASAAYANRIAGIVPVCGADGLWTGNTVAAANLPIWATHNTGDPTIPVSRTVNNVNLVNNAPIAPNPLARKTIFTANGHDAWTKTYDPSFKENNMNVYEWMLTHKRFFVALPVSGLTFNAVKKDNNKVQLNWKTYSETNNRGFVLERSSNSQTWDSIGFAASLSISGGGAEYTFTDQFPRGGKNYYRLKQQNLNGSITYSDIRFVDLNSKSLNEVTVYPNPVKGQLNINTSLTFNKAQLNIRNAAGQLVQKATISGAGTIAVQLKDIVSGVYAAQIVDGDRLINFRFIKL